MIRKKLYQRRRSAVAIGIVSAVLVLASNALMAADHRDSPRSTAEPPADINDVYAWTTQDTSRLNLIMTVFPRATGDARFSDAVEYVFHVSSSATVGGPATNSAILCTFAADQRITCSIGGTQLVTSVDASDTDGVESEDGNFRVFAGLRSDPFFFALDAFNTTVSTVVQAAPNLQFNDAGCPALDSATQTALATSLRGPNTFAGGNVLAIVVQVDKTLLGPGPIYGVWASTSRAGQ